MNALSPEAIIELGARITPSLVYHPTSIGYLQVLLTPYAEVLEPADEVTMIQQWITAAFPDIAQEMTSSIFIDGMNYDAPGALNDIKVSIITFILTKIMETSDVFLHLNEKETILPWHIKLAIIQSPDIDIFGFDHDDDLPTNVTLDTTFTHNLSQEFVEGLLLLSSIANHDFHVELFGAEISPDIINVLRTEENFNYVNGGYSVKMNGRKYSFISTDFMQGFATGALWLNVDHHLYWSDLLEYSYDDKINDLVGTPVSF